jgi:hypothetical protein
MQVFQVPQYMNMVGIDTGTPPTNIIHLEEEEPAVKMAVKMAAITVLLSTLSRPLLQLHVLLPLFTHQSKAIPRRIDISTLLRVLTSTKTSSNSIAIIIRGGGSCLGFTAARPRSVGLFTVA